jgi:hypothetical protein
VELLSGANGRGGAGAVVGGTAIGCGMAVGAGRSGGVEGRGSADGWADSRCFGSSLPKRGREARIIPSFLPRSTAQAQSADWRRI